MLNLKKLNFSCFFWFWGLLLFLFSCKSIPANNPNQQTLRIINPKYQYKDNLGEVLKYRVKGLSQITASGKQTAYDQAIEHGLRKAVEQALGIYLDSQTKVNNQVLIEDNIHANAYGFIQKYQIEKTWQEDDVVYQRLLVWVVLGDIKDNLMALNLLQDRVNRPYVVIKIRGKNFSGQKVSFSQEKVIRKFLEKQFVVLNDNSSSTDTPNFFPEIKIQGEINSQFNDTSKNRYLKGSSLQSVSTVLSLKAYTVNDSKLITSISGEKTTVHLNANSAQQKAANQLTDQLMDRFIEEIFEQWDKAINHGFEYQVNVQRISSQEVLKFKGFIQKKVQGIKAVFDKKYVQKNLTLLVRFTGTSSQLANYLSSPRNPVSLAIEQYDSRVIRLKKQ